MNELPDLFDLLTAFTSGVKGVISTMDKDVRDSIGRPEFAFIEFRKNPLAVDTVNFSITTLAFKLLTRSKV